MRRLLLLLLLVGCTGPALDDDDTGPVGDDDDAPDGLPRFCPDFEGPAGASDGERLDVVLTDSVGEWEAEIAGDGLEVPTGAGGYFWDGSCVRLGVVPSGPSRICPRTPSIAGTTAWRWTT